MTVSRDTLTSFDGLQKYHGPALLFRGQRSAQLALKSSLERLVEGDDTPLNYLQGLHPSCFASFSGATTITPDISRKSSRTSNGFP